MFKMNGKATSAVMAGLLAVGMAASPLAPAVALATNSSSVGNQTGSGHTDLTMILVDTDEHGGTAEPRFLDDWTENPLYNPDNDGDGIGNNLAFTVPSAINYVVDATGHMMGPTNATIQNRSVMGINVSSVDVDEETPFTIVADATASSVDNSVDLQFGPVEDRPFENQLNAADYLTKTDVADATKWAMGAEGADDANLGIRTGGHVSHITQDITQQRKFGTIKWYLRATQHQATMSNTLVSGSELHTSMASLIGSGWESLGNMTGFVFEKRAPDPANDGVLVSEGEGASPVYFNYSESTGIGRFISESDKLVLNEDCSGMFEGLYGLTSADMSMFDTSNVTNMNAMFSGCGALSSLDVSGWDTSNVTNMADMFAECAALTLDCSDWDVSNVTEHSGFNTHSSVVAPNWSN